MKGAAKMFVDPKTNELIVADGYGNRRVIVFDADTGKYKRHWGAYGKKPDDAPMPRDNPSDGRRDVRDYLRTYFLTSLGPTSAA